MAQASQQQRLIKQDSKQTNKQNKSKPSYKHIPHSQKPPHLVAKRNARERRRVQAVNQAFYKLRRSVPIENRNKRVSKVKTLQRAIDYIRQLERILEEDDGQARIEAAERLNLTQSIISSTTTNGSGSSNQQVARETRKCPSKSSTKANCDQESPARQKRGRKPANQQAATADTSQPQNSLEFSQLSTSVASHAASELPPTQVASSVDYYTNGYAAQHLPASGELTGSNLYATNYYQQQQQPAANEYLAHNQHQTSYVDQQQQHHHQQAPYESMLYGNPAAHNYSASNGFSYSGPAYQPPDYGLAHEPQWRGASQLASLQSAANLSTASSSSSSSSAAAPPVPDSTSFALLQSPASSTHSPSSTASNNSSLLGQSQSRPAVVCRPAAIQQKQQPGVTRQTMPLGGRQVNSESPIGGGCYLAYANATRATNSSSHLSFAASDKLAQQPAELSSGTRAEQQSNGQRKPAAGQQQQQQNTDNGRQVRHGVHLQPHLNDRHLAASSNGLPQYHQQQSSFSTNNHILSKQQLSTSQQQQQQSQSLGLNASLDSNGSSHSAASNSSSLPAAIQHLNLL